ncbi:hypothetical protein SOVF_042100, partial [Spinacia oleracea]
FLFSLSSSSHLIFSLFYSSFHHKRSHTSAAVSIASPPPLTSLPLPIDLVADISPLSNSSVISLPPQAQAQRRSPPSYYLTLSWDLRKHEIKSGRLWIMLESHNLNHPWLILLNPLRFKLTCVVN